MRGTLRIGRVFGIELHVDWTWLFVIGLITWNVTLIFRRWHPTWAIWPALLLAAIASVSVFVSILTHELAHAVVAQRFGLRVREVRLFLFGGVSDIEEEPSSPVAEFWMAIAGPLVSLSLGAVLMLTTSRALNAVLDPLAAVARLSPFQTIISWIGPMNIALGTLNLIPGFPLDGGRVLRAAVWKATGDLHRSTYIAAKVGSIIGGGMMLVGIALALGYGKSPGGLWLALLGWYLRVAAKRSFVALMADDVLEGVRVKKIMRRNGTTVGPFMTLRSVADDAFTQSSEHALPVVEGPRLVGLLTLHDVRKVSPAAWDTTDVESVMTPARALTLVGPEDAVREAVAKLAQRDVSQLPVVDGEAFVGMFSRDGVARWLELALAAAKRPVAARRMKLAS